jgi:hypothetical protein
MPVGMKLIEVDMPKPGTIEMANMPAGKMFVDNKVVL